MESKQKAMEEGKVGSQQHLQERTFYYKKACDVMMAIHDKNRIFGTVK
jgi:hypothetical protein